VVLGNEGAYKIRVAARDRKGNTTRLERTVKKIAGGINLDEEP
jgi:hypothetical protein